MARLDVKTQDPERYAQVKAEQEELKLQFSMAAFGTSVARLCPYCEHKIEILYRGEHGPSRAKCPNCGADITQGSAFCSECGQKL